jgi:hypothetical protein
VFHVLKAVAGGARLQLSPSNHPLRSGEFVGSLDLRDRSIEVTADTVGDVVISIADELTP